MDRNKELKVHRLRLPGRSLCSIRSNRKWCKRRGSSLQCQNCFFVYPIIDCNLKNLRAVAMASGYRLSPGIPSDSSTCLQSGQRSVSSNMTTLHFLHLFIIYSVRLNLHIHTIRRNLAEKCLLYQSLGKDGTECKYQRILVRTDRSFQILPF